MNERKVRELHSSTGTTTGRKKHLLYSPVCPLLTNSGWTKMWKSIEFDRVLFRHSRIYLWCGGLRKPEFADGDHDEKYWSEDRSVIGDYQRSSDYPVTISASFHKTILQAIRQIHWWKDRPGRARSRVFTFTFDQSWEAKKQCRCVEQHFPMRNDLQEIGTISL